VAGRFPLVVTTLNRRIELNVQVLS
jgi:hypothetical protein